MNDKFTLRINSFVDGESNDQTGPYKKFIRLNFVEAYGFNYCTEMPDL